MDDLGKVVATSLGLLPPGCLLARPQDALSPVRPKAPAAAKAQDKREEKPEEATPVRSKLMTS